MEFEGDQPFTANQLIGWNTVLQLVLVSAAFGLGRWLELDWWNRPPTFVSVFSSAAGGALLALLFWRVSESDWSWLEQLRNDCRRLAQIFAPAKDVSSLATISVMAGIGEEAFFRGLLQPAIALVGGDHLAITATALIFAGLHLISISYFIYASMMGMLLGLLAWHTESVYPAMAAHAAFDFVALRLILRNR